MSCPDQSVDGENFQTGEEAGITVLSLFLFIGMLMAAGFAIDISNAAQSRAQLQGAADAAGHAALFWRWRNSEADAKAKAVEIAELNMPTVQFGNVLATTDVEFGYWDSNSRTFTADPLRQTAVRVTAQRNRTSGNGVSTFLMHMIGQGSLNLTSVSVWDSGDGFCRPKPNGQPGEGYFARGIIDLQSNNTFRDGFCIHSSKEHVELQQGGFFEDGVTVSMPDRSDVVLPASGLDERKNPGLKDALKSQSMNLDAFFNDLSDLMESYQDPFSDVNADRIRRTNVNSKDIKKNLTSADIEEGAVNVFSCKPKTLTIDKDTVIRNAVIVTSCEVKFSSGAAIENAVLITTSPSSKTISAPSGLRIGAEDFCATGDGAATLMTAGDFTAAAGLEAFGSTIIAGGDIKFTSNADGMAGAQMLAGDRIDATSNGEMGHCDFGPPTDFLIPVFRMVM